MNKPAAITAIDAGFRARFTTAEFLHMAEAGAFDDMKVELVDGELERMNSPMSRHAGLQAVILSLLWQVTRDSPRTILGEVGIDIGDNTLLGCDIALLAAPIDGNRLVQPEELLLVIEIAETTIARDMGMKRIKYATGEIANYWVVDARRSVVHVYGHPIDGDYAQVNTIRFGEPLAVPGTPETITID